jgi:hypothetical protein
MRKRLYWLSEADGKRLEPSSPRGRPGAHRVDVRVLKERAGNSREPMAIFGALRALPMIAESHRINLAIAATGQMTPFGQRRAISYARQCSSTGNMASKRAEVNWSMALGAWQP